MEGRLQFKHDPTVYGSKAEIEGYINGAINRYLRTGNEALEKFVPILGEPVVYRYKSAEEELPHLVLGIGLTQSVAEPNGAEIETEFTPTYSLLDFDSLENGLEDIDGIFEEIKNIVNGLGFDEEGNFNPDSHPEHWGDEKYFNGEEKTISNYIRILRNEVERIDNDVDNLILSYENEEVVLKHSDGTPITSFSARPFIKDGMIDMAKFIDTYEKAEEFDEDDNHAAGLPYILIVWNTDSGKEKTRIPLESFYDVYVGHNGVNIEGFDVSLQLDRQTEDFLSVSANGLKLSGVQNAINDAKREAVTISNEYTDEKITELVETFDSTLNDLSDEYNQVVAELNSSITKNAESIAENKSEIENLKDFNEHKVGSLDGEVISTVVSSNRDRIDSLEDRADSAEIAIAAKVDKVEGKGLSTNDYTNEEKALLATLSQNAQENVIEKVKVNGALLDVTNDKAVNIEVPFTKLSDDEKILTLSNDGTLESMFSVEYDSNAKKIFFYGKTNSKIGEIDATNFITDGMIRDVNVITENGEKYLRFVFNTDAGNREIKIALTDLVTYYTVSGGSENYLAIDNFKIGLKVDQADYSGLASGVALHNLDDKYSAITHSIDDKVGEGFTDENDEPISVTHKVNELSNIIDTFVEENQIEFTEDFKVAGIVGTLGTGKWKNGDIIPAGTKIADVLKDILQQRLRPVGVAPTAAVKLIGPSSVEVGTPIVPSYQVIFNPGKYEFSDGTANDTLITPDTVSVILQNNGTNVGTSATGLDGSLGEVTATDGMNLSLIANISYSSTYIPKDNLGDEVPECKIPNGTLEFIQSENTITSYRPMFYGTLKDGDIADLDQITSQEVLTYLTKATGETIDKIIINNDAEVVIIMIPVQSNKNIKKIIDTDSGFDLVDVFERKQVRIKTYAEEASENTGYYVFTYDPKTQIGENVYKIIYGE